MKKSKSKKMNRRSFIKKSAAIGASSILGGGLIIRPGKIHSQTPVPRSKKSLICSVEGSDSHKATIKAVETLGGIEKFVPKNSRVAILANAQRSNPGSFTNPAILAAVIQMCQKAGAKEINCLTLQSQGNWQKTGLKEAADKGGAKVVFVDSKDEKRFKNVAIPNGKAIKQAMIMKEFFNHDIFINIPITKDHAGNKFTGTLKNLMGLNAQKSNRQFHQKNWRTDINSITHLDQCIADLNTVVTPDLCVVDATEFIITNGPFGPGELKKPHQVVAGTDRVAIDAYCCQLWGLNPEDIIMIKKAAEHHLGAFDQTKVQVKQIKI